MDGDRPITRREDDRLGFTPVAEHLARAIADLPAAQGFVFGIEGKWGSGKSTLINLTVDSLKSYGDAAPEIILFSPWLVGGRDELLQNLFDELATAAVKIDPIEIDVPDDDASWWMKLRRTLSQDKLSEFQKKERVKKAIGQKLKSFGHVATTISKVTKLASTFGLPGAELASSAIDRSSEFAKELATGGSISKRKAALVDALKFLSRRIVVFVDDLDRLEPREASEVLRLIRAVADFPNIVYVLSYDPVVVAQTLSKAVQVDDGAAFLEKIVQVSFRVPRPEAFDLRRWFRTEVYKLFAEELRDIEVAPQDIESRLAQAIDVQGGRYLKTGRDVIRALNALRLHAMPVRKLIDVPDMVWLQLVRIGNTDFYSWIEEYLVEVAAIATGARLSDGEEAAMAQRLEKILRDERRDVDRTIFELQEIVPGLRPSDHGHESIRVYQELTTKNVANFVSSRRLGSPHHYRFYYAFAQPSGSLADEQVQAFIDVAERSAQEAVQMFLDLAATARPQGGSVAEMLVDRLETIADKIPDDAIFGIASALSDAMDDRAFTSTRIDFGERPAWDAANRLLTRLLERTAGEQRAAIIRRMFVEGKALGWLTGIFRNETFAHGIYGDRRASEDRWLLTAGEFTEVSSIMLGRYRDAQATELLRVPSLMSLLFAWLHGGGAEDVKAWVDRQIQTDEGLLALLSRIRGWAASSSRGVYYPLRRRELAQFLDYEVVLGECKKLHQRDRRN